MKNNKWCVAIAFVTLLSLPGMASAHDMGKKDGASHHHMMHKGKMCHDGMKADFKKDRADFEKMHALHKKLHAVLTAKTFDKKSFIALSDQMINIRSQMEKRHTAAFATMAAKMSPEERAKMAAGFHGHEHGEGGWGHHTHVDWSHGMRSQNNGTHDPDRPTN